MGSPTAGAAGRCHLPGAVSTVTAGAGPFLRPGAVSPSLHRLPAPVGPTGQRGGFGSPHVQKLDPPTRDAPVQNTRSAWAGARGETQALGWAGPQGDPETLANRHPPVEPALYHRGSPTVVGGGWGA